jgi:hypothetical protein
MYIRIYRHTLRDDVRGSASRKAGCDYDGGCGESLAKSSDRPAIGRRMGKVFPEKKCYFVC